MLEHCEPKAVFHFFEQITQIPHGSGNTEQISDYLVRFAKERKLHYKQDKLGNVIIFKEASAGYEEEEPVILQGHMDMVAVKDADCTLDLSKDGLDVRVEGDYVYAKGTSLGGDDGIAIAYALAILDDDTIQHPPLEVVITVEEETGMEGASFIDLSDCKAKKVINLDSEEEGEFIVSCAGGVRIYGKVETAYKEQAVSPDRELYEIRIAGLTGGHSGAEIHHGRANANIVLGQVLKQLSEQFDIELCKLSGGTKDNAIPVDANAVIAVLTCQKEQFLQEICQIQKKMQEKWQTTDPKLVVEAVTVENKCIRPLTETVNQNVIHILTECPNGVQAMCTDMPDLVETSLNLGVLTIKEEQIVFEFSLRSSVRAAKEELARKLCEMLEANGAVCERSGDYPAWEYRKDSPLRDKMVAVYEDMYGKEPKVLALHAGLECGILSEKIPGLDCVSIGPDMKDIHTTRERLSISSTKRVWDYLLEVLRVRKNVVLIGMPGAGKSTVGVVLAKNLGYRFVDSDLVIQHNSGKLLHELISERGIDGFQAYEDEVNASIYEDKCVIATGGSAIFGEHAMKHFDRIGTIVYLKLPYEEIEERLGDLTKRGVTVKPGQTLRDLYEERIPLYEKYANVTIDCEHKSIREIVAEIAERIPETEA